MEACPHGAWARHALGGWWISMMRWRAEDLAPWRSYRSATARRPDTIASPREKPARLWLTPRVPWRNVLDVITSKNNTSIASPGSNGLFVGGFKSSPVSANIYARRRRAWARARSMRTACLERPEGRFTSASGLGDQGAPHVCRSDGAPLAHERGIGGPDGRKFERIGRRTGKVG